MSLIYLIYHPPQRIEIQKLVDQLASIGIQTKLAPLGFQAGSDKWKEQVREDLKGADVAVVILTEAAMSDETVYWRLKLASELNLPVIPISLIPDYKTASYMFQNSMLNRDTGTASVFIDYALIAQYNWLYLNEATIENVLPFFTKLLKSVLPPQKLLNCFISYSRKDHDFTTKLVETLQATGIETWMDTKDILPGTNWDREIEQAIVKCTHVLLIASETAVASENVIDEVSFAIEKEKTIIPLKIEMCQLPMRIHRAQWIDYTNDFDMGTVSLLKALGIKGK